MSMFLKSLALCSAGLLMAASTAVAQQTAPARDVTQAVSALHREWILVGWEKKEGDGPFDFRSKLGRFYELGARDLMLYDDFEPQRRVARSADQYGGFWTGPFTSLKSAKHAVVDAPSTLVSGDLASSTLEFTARLEAPDGKITAIRTRSSLTWRLSDAQWKIVREHNSSTVRRTTARGPDRGGGSALRVLISPGQTWPHVRHTQCRRVALCVRTLA